jgi:hypothetical protein
MLYCTILMALHSLDSLRSKVSSLEQPFRGETSLLSIGGNSGSASFRRLPGVGSDTYEIHHGVSLSPFKPGEAVTYPIFWRE